MGLGLYGGQKWYAHTVWRTRRNYLWIVGNFSLKYWFSDYSGIDFDRFTRIFVIERSVLENSYVLPPRNHTMSRAKQPCNESSANLKKLWKSGGKGCLHLFTSLSLVSSSALSLVNRWQIGSIAIIASFDLEEERYFLLRTVATCIVQIVYKVSSGKTQCKKIDAFK